MGKNIKSNVKTTVAGLITAGIAVAHAALALVNGDQPDWTVTVTAVSAAIGLLFAKDGDK